MIRCALATAGAHDLIPPQTAAAGIGLRPAWHNLPSLQSVSVLWIILFSSRLQPTRTQRHFLRVRILSLQ